MRITEEQERILGSLHCERLSSNVDNFRLVDDFYVDNLEFIDASEHSAATPMYDFACRFLCQETSTLQERRTSFFEHFNPDEEV